MSSIPAKIVISSSTKVSLNDRFTKLSQAKVTTNAPVKSNSDLARISNQATIQNRKLALQMANRPSVQAALKLKNKSIKQRIGNNPNVGKLNQPQSNTLKQKESQQQGQKTNVKSRIDLAARLSLNGIPLRKNARAGVASSLRGRVQVKGVFSPKKNDLKRISSGGNISKNHLRSFDGGKKKNFNKGQGNKKGFAQNKGRAFGGKVKNAKKEPEVKTKEGLDMELESYMAKSKGHLDADLDSYMSHSNAN